MENSPFKGVKTFFFGYFVVLMLILTGIGVMGWLGYQMIDASIQYVLFGLLVVSAAVAGAWWVMQRIVRPWMKAAAGMCMGALILALALLLYTVFSFVLVSATPLPYERIKSPSGRQVVVLKKFSRDAAMAAQRMTAAGKDASQGPQSAEDTGYLYMAYPVAMGLFYKGDAPSQGSLEIGTASDARLNYLWTDENTLHITIDQPRIGDGGEFILQMD